MSRRGFSLLPVSCLVLLTVLVQAAPQPEKTESLPKGAVARIGKPRLRHQGSVISVAFAPDGKTFASVGNDKTARIWDTATGRELMRFTGHTRGIQAVAFTPDGKSLLTGSHDATLRLWDIATGKEVRQFSGHTEGILVATISHDGKLAASEAHDATIRIWDLATGKEQLQIAGHASQGTSNLVFSPDSKTLASVGADMRIWDVANGKELMKLEGHSDDVNSLDFSRDGKLLASAGNDQTIRLWDVASGKELRKLTGHEELGATVRFAPDGKTVVSGSMDRTIRVWDVATGKELVKMLGHTNVVSELSVSPDGKTVVSAGHDNTIRLWDIKTGKELPQSGGLVLCSAVSPDGKVLATGCADHMVRFWDAGIGKPLATELTARSPVVAVAFGPDGKTLFSGGEDGKILRWDVEAGKVLGEYASARERPLRLHVSGDGKTLAQIGISQTVRMWDVQTGKDLPLTLPGPMGGKLPTLSCLAFAPDGKTFALAGNDRQNVSLYSLATGREVRAFTAPAGVRDIAFSRDGRTLAVSCWGEGAVLLFETATGVQRRSWTNLQTTAGTLALSADGRLLAAGCQDMKVRVWDVATNQEVRTLEGHEAPLSQVLFGERSLLTAGSDTSLIVWDLPAMRKDLKALATTLKPAELDALWSDLGERDGERPQHAVWALASAPEVSLPLLRERLAKNAGPTDDTKKIAKLIGQLDDDDFNVRESATQELIRIGRPAEQAVREVLKKTASAEVRRRAETVLESFKGGVTGTPETLRPARAVEVLEKIGTLEARKLLADLAKGAAESALTQEAKAALERMGGGK